MAEQEDRSLVRFDPFEDLDFFGRGSPFRGRAGLARILDEGRPGRFIPAVDIAEDDDRYVITVEVPGAKKDDVTVEMHENVLTIRGEKRSEREEEKEHPTWRARSSRRPSVRRGQNPERPWARLNPQSASASR